jgi:hypothetical protein
MQCGTTLSTSHTPTKLERVLKTFPQIAVHRNFIVVTLRSNSGLQYGHRFG